MNNWNALILGIVIGYLFRLLFHSMYRAKGKHSIMKIPSVVLVKIGHPVVNKCRASGSTKTSH